MKMSLRLTNVARITACTIKLVSYARGESLRERSFTLKKFPILNVEKTSLMLESLRASSIRQTANVRFKLRICQNRK